VPALTSKLAPRSAQASPRAFWSSAGSPFLPARTPFSTMVAVTLARPACAAGSRRLPASKSSCASTIGSALVDTR